MATIWRYSLTDELDVGPNQTSSKSNLALIGTGVVLVGTIDLIATVGFVWRLGVAPPLSAWLVTINFLTGGAALCGASLILLRSAARR